jgi:hypothetical protein
MIGVVRAEVHRHSYTEASKEMGQQSVYNSNSLQNAFDDRPCHASFFHERPSFGFPSVVNRGQDLLNSGHYMVPIGDVLWF